MRVWIAALTLMISCNKDKDEGTDTGGDTETDADADADADADSDADTDADNPVAGMRVANASEAYGTADLYLDGDTSPLFSLPALASSPWGPLFEGGLRQFAMTPQGGDPGIDGTTIEIDVQQDARYTLVLYGTPEAPVFLGFEEDVGGLTAADIRYNFHHTIPGLGPIDVYDATTHQPLAVGLTYGTPAMSTTTAGEITFGLDIDANGDLDLTYSLPDVGSQVFVPLFFTLQGADIVMLGLSPGGQFDISLPTVLGDTGVVPDSGDTAGGATGDTGGTSDTSDTGA